VPNAASAALAPPERGCISPSAFARLARFMENHAGVKLPPNKRLLVETRLSRCLRLAGCDNLDDYCDYVLSDAAIPEHRDQLIGALTTHKTDFFREPAHFDVIAGMILPQFAAEGVREVRCWSAAASTGMEAYTLAMVIADHAERTGGPEFSILASDIDVNVLAEARRGVYPLEAFAPVPGPMRRKYVRRANDPARAEGRIVPALRRRIAAARLNLMDAHYPVGAPMDLVLCRNVLFYFDKAIQAEVVARLCDAIRPGGYLVLGHSETLGRSDLPLLPVGNTVFRRT
jgi:chemotaxis protein methyltransferase CheR